MPLHLGVTEAGLPPEGILKTRRHWSGSHRWHRRHHSRIAYVPAARKHEEVEAGRQILADVAAGRALGRGQTKTRYLNIISCPSCSRVQNQAFVDLAERVREATRYASTYPITIAVMGCRVNGRARRITRSRTLCGPNSVNLMRGGMPLGAFSYEDGRDSP